ncbi:DUF4097 domain-containing protein [Streptomyces sp. DH37]|uniref:DUF4097 family beta strand repeat-containing protein n=1 Tax=Streptomyces sp. DH37 TaxID=3040122 RepID=UPI002443343A|nr:DUF4097 family beta strand repeat-containing protein [Streptomyces sp. DH37]MDG9702280.1 hypothetical protein [Streptomyces sp. DH37]
MPGRSEWSVDEPCGLVFEEDVHTLRVRVVGGAVNVVGTGAPPARLEVGAVTGPPLTVRLEDGTLTVAYDDLPWKGFLTLLDREGGRHSADVSLAVPAGVRVEVGVIGADAVLTGIGGRAEVRGITGGVTLVGLSGDVRADTVSGGVEAQGVTGDLRFSSVSGDLTVIDGGGSSVRADSVSGDMVVDLAPARERRRTDVRLNSVSGGIALRLPDPADAVVDAGTAGGAVSCAFEDLRVSGQWGARRITGTLGRGGGLLRATTVSGSIALLRRPEPDAGEEAGDPHGPGGTPPPAEPSPRKDV